MDKFVRPRRNHWNPRAQFISSIGLFAILGTFALWGFKTPAILFYILQKKEEDEGRGISWLEDSNLARIILFYTIETVFLYNIYCPSILQTRIMAQLVGNVACKYWDLGSIPRSPHIIHNIFSNTILCSNHPVVHPKPHASASQVSLNFHPVAKRWGTWYSPVKQHAHDSWKSTRLGLLMGQNSLTQTSTLGQHTPLVCIFILFSFLFLNSFNCYNNYY